MNVHDIAASAAINSLSVLGFLLGFAFLRLQPINDRVYFAKWYVRGIRAEPKRSESCVKHFVNLNCKSYLKFWNWMPAALRMPEPELIENAGLDSVAYIRIYLLGLKIFVPIAVLSFSVLVPVNCTGGTLNGIKDLTYSDIDKLSMANVPSGSKRLWAHVIMAYVFSIWTYYTLYQEYQIITTKRLRFLAAEKRRPDQFTVLVRNVPPDPDESVSEHVEHFFRVNHPDYYLLHQVVYNANKLAGLVEQKKSLKNWLTYYETRFERNPQKQPRTRTGFWGLYGKTVNAIDHHRSEIEKIIQKEAEEREKVTSDPKAILPASFVSFKSRWGAVVCAQTQQAHNPTLWVTEWAPEPRDVYWNNLAIPYVSLSIRKLIAAVAMFFFTFFFMIPITFVQSLASIDGVMKVLPFLKSVIPQNAESVVQGFLPGLVLKIFMALVPLVLMEMSKIEGHVSVSTLERRTAGKYHLFVLINVFLGSIAAGAAFQQLHKFLNQSASEIPKTMGVAMPMKATFFITYVMVDGWAGIAAEVIRLIPLVIFHLKNTFLVKTEQDREEATDPGSLCFYITEPRTQLYFLQGLVYSVVTPVILPFIIVFFAFAYVIYRHQIINVYDQKYESAAKFWPDVHRRVLTGLIISQILLIGLMNTKDVSQATPVLLVLPVLTIWFHYFCKGRFESVFVKFPLQEAMMKDTIERVNDPKFDVKAYLHDAYVHPVFKELGMRRQEEEGVNVEENNLVPTKRSSRNSSQCNSGARSVRSDAAEGNPHVTVDMPDTLD